MSPGHLDHYFPSKEAIIEAIAERDLQQTLALIETASADPDFVDGLVSAGMEQENAGPAYGLDGPLGAEIVAEAARNPRIAGILRHFRREMGRLLLDAVRAAQASGRLDPRLDPDEAVLLLTLLHEGYSMCRVADPDFHSPRTIELVRAVLRRALSVEADGRTGEAPLP
jgi:AcrR family transcriptional regulator